MPDNSRLYAADQSRAPVVDFNRPPNVIQEMLDRRRANDSTIALLQKLESDCRRDGDKMSRDAKLYAAIAAGWASVLALSDTSRALLSLRFRFADKAFGKIDKMTSKLDKLLNAAGSPQLKKEDLIKNLGSEYAKPITLINDVQHGRELLQKLGANETREVRVILDGVIGISEDVMLFKSALDVGQSVSKNVINQTFSTSYMLNNKINKYKNENIKLNNIIIYEFEKIIRISKTV